ncbi:TonB-dependent receptor [Aestuariivivens sediminis]|uniref:TonB-dependent receptor n=1 Tax=Aestuariivivens sediminis TaxID=2913557 RepID=UPI001F59D66C|nr:TonB-dependent receptor [Aestuariivivens sediminis]
MKNIILILFCLLGLSLKAQNHIQGRLTDALSKQPIEGANLYFPELEKGTMSQAQGEFYIKNIPNGTHKIIISYLGYETLSITVDFPYNGTLTIDLEPSVIEMEGIIISTPFHKLQSENVMKVERENANNLQKQGAVTLAQGLSNISGVKNNATGLSIGKPVIRGLSSNRVLVYTQGIRLENQQFGSEHGLGLSSNGIESIEVIKGPASLLYGSDALGGVIYINPERFALNNTAQADISTTYFSNTLGYNSHLGAKQSGDRFKFLFRGGVAEHADYKTKDYRVTNTRFRETDLKAGIGYQMNRFKTELRYNLNQSKLGIPEDIGEPSRLKTPLFPFQYITNHVLSSRSTIFLNNSKLDVNFGLLYNDRKEFEDHHHGEEAHGDEHEEEHEEDHEEDLDDPIEAALHMKLKTLNYDIKYHLPEFGKFETIVGLQGMTQSNANYGEEQLIPDATTHDIGLLATSHIHFKKADVQLGARIDNRQIKVPSGIHKTFNSFNGALGLKTTVLNGWITRVNLATGFRAPNLAELTSNGSHEGANRYEIGNETLKNESNLQFDLSMEYQSDHFECFVNGFYNTVSDYIYLAPNGNFIDGDPVFIYLQDDAKLYGGEMGFHLHPHPLDWLHFESSFETVTGKQGNNDDLPLIPANTLTHICRAEFDKDWLKNGYGFIKYQFTFSQNNISSFETPTGAYQLLSLGAGGIITMFNKPLDIRIAVTNLTNRRYIDHLSRLKPDGILNMGRNVSLGMTYSL